jgi:hypothetical protein
MTCSSLFFQTKSFQYEREVRIITDADTKITLNDGLKINVDISLIEKIYIHPKSENWYKKSRYCISRTTRIWLYY